MPRFFFILFAMLLAMISCSDDTETLPSYRQDLACILTNSWGNAATLLRDDGTALNISNTVGGLTADSTYRVLALYTEDCTAGSAHLTDYAVVLTVNAATYRTSSLITDPLSVLACWKSGGYLNLNLSLKCTNSGVHYFGLHKASLTQHADGSKMLNLLLIHSQNNDPLYYSRQAYLSMPLQTILNDLNQGRDSVSVAINTFDGELTYKFAL